MDVLSEDTLTLQTMLSSAQEMKFDNEGRVMLSDDFIQYAELEEVALFSGIGRSFEIWNPAHWRPRDAETRHNARNGKVPKLSFAGTHKEGNS
jgi:MraZ protein